ncbi:MAG: chorismate-binding protein [Pricia sp.]
MRKTRSFTVSDVVSFTNKLLSWAQQFEEVAWLDSNGHYDRYGAFDALLAVDGHTSLVTDAPHAFVDLQKYQKGTRDWIFGYLTYDLKNDIERLSSGNVDGLHFPELYFFQPKKIIRLIGETVDFIYLSVLEDDIAADFAEISRIDDYDSVVHGLDGLDGDKRKGLRKDENKGFRKMETESSEKHKRGSFEEKEIAVTEKEHGASTDAEKPNRKNIRIKLRTFKDDYFRRVNEMLAHIHRGDIYEANFCQEFYAEHTEIDALKTYQKLNSISKAPFATFLKIRDKYLLCASPERYLKKMGNRIISQPIKGTAKRAENPEMDAALKVALQTDPKERAENIMIVDLVRNDLSKSALKGSVQVEELCKVYTFEQVHQMISTVTAAVPDDKNPVEIIRETYPMGSMTGAPKISAMQIIDQLEAFKRGLYSGAVGYFTPEGNFDFNVVIRSILYNATHSYVSYAVGSAITAKSVPEREYEECLLKAKAMREVLGD